MSLLHRYPRRITSSETTTSEKTPFYASKVQDFVYVLPNFIKNVLIEFIYCDFMDHRFGVGLVLRSQLRLDFPWFLEFTPTTTWETTRKWPRGCLWSMLLFQNPLGPYLWPG